MKYKRPSPSIFNSALFYEVSLKKNLKKRCAVIKGDAPDYAYLSTAGYPYLYQLIGYHIWEQDIREDEITLREVKRVVEQQFTLTMSNFNIPVETRKMREHLKKGIIILRLR